MNYDEFCKLPREEQKALMAAMSPVESQDLMNQAYRAMFKSLGSLLFYVLMCALFAKWVGFW